MKFVTTNFQKKANRHIAISLLCHYYTGKIGAVQIHKVYVFKANTHTYPLFKSIANTVNIVMKPNKIALRIMDVEFRKEIKYNGNSICAVKKTAM